MRLLEQRPEYNGVRGLLSPYAGPARRAGHAPFRPIQIDNGKLEKTDHSFDEAMGQ
ncbi:hypothetical protein JWJ88_20500 (plasmid) [Paracoccus methylovorus]|uniref:Uncharacterized protein n=1 Tax=Paracoccus methylovorus TaxID=2812658 RepID=A0ABX7JSK1_9RHOB|nr:MULTISPECIES: hypothetical protein [Paracoccus]QRZ16273.1 hypothetical protein JWJ88_20500 [Paracoccus methylovorus]